MNCRISNVHDERMRGGQD